MKLNWKLLLILILAAFLRLYQLGNIPPSLDWDEASLAYNAQSLMQTGHDEYGNSWPITIRSFNDYKPALYTYSIIPSLSIFGKSDFAIRFPSALAGILTVLVTWLLVRLLFPNKKYLPEISSFLLAISPWHLQFSRVAFEANLSLMFFVFGIYFLTKTIRQSKFLPLSALSFSASMMAYHSTKLIIPLLLIFLAPLFIKQLKKDKRAVVLSAIIAIFTLSLIGRTIHLGVGQSRLGSVSILTIDDLFTKSISRITTDQFSIISRVFNHRLVVISKEFIGGYIDHFDPNFWFIKGDTNDRHRAVTHGLLYWWTLPFLFSGIIYLVKKKNNPARKILFTWFLVAPIAAALTSGTPNSVRAIFFLPTFQIFTAIGIVQAISYLKANKSLRTTFCSLLFAVFIISNIVIYFHNYYIHTPKETSQAWQYGYKQMVEYVLSINQDYDRVIVTTGYDQPYIYFLWYGDYSPKIINPGDFNQKLDNLEFREVNWYEDMNFTNTLLIGISSEIKEPSKAIWQVNFLDGSPSFLAVESVN